MAYRSSMRGTFSAVLLVLVLVGWVGRVAAQEPEVQSVTFDPPMVYCGQDATATITLDIAAPQGGTKVRVYSGMSGMPEPESAEYTVPAGQKTVTFRAPNTAQTYDMYRYYVGRIGSNKRDLEALLNIEMIAYSLSFNSVRGLALTTTRATVKMGTTDNLNQQHATRPPHHDLVLGLRPMYADSAGFVYPSSITLLKGQTSVTFDVKLPFTTEQKRKFLEVYGEGWSHNNSIVVDPIKIIALTADRDHLVGGEQTNGKVTINPTAPEDISITLAGSEGKISMPQQCLIRAGTNSATFPVLTNIYTGPLDTMNGFIFAGFGVPPSYPSVGLAQKELLMARGGTAPGVRITGIAFEPANVKGGETTTLKLTLSGPAPQGGVSFLLENKAGRSGVLHPGMVTVPAGQNTANVSVTTFKRDTVQSVCLKVYRGEASAEASMEIPPYRLKDFRTPSTTLFAGQDLKLTFEIDTPAPSGGGFVSISSSDIAVIDPFVQLVRIAEGQTTGTLVIKPAASDKKQSATLTAGTGGVTKTLNVSVVPDGPKAARGTPLPRREALRSPTDMKLPKR